MYEICVQQHTEILCMKMHTSFLSSVCSKVICKNFFASVEHDFFVENKLFLWIVTNRGMDRSVPLSFQFSN